MKLAASLIVRNEFGRYLEPCIGHLLEFCDEVRVLDDHSDDDSWQWLRAQDERVQPLRDGDVPAFFAHEGHTRQRLLEWTLAGSPSHVLAIDADELVADGAALRRALEERADHVAFPLNMLEVWEAESDHLCIREDGGWRSHNIPAVWKVPSQLDATWRISDRALACGRVPRAIDQSTAYLGLFSEQVSDLLHFGWASEAGRQARYDRYVEHDGGRFHASAHLQSILAPCERITLRPREWPAGLDGYRAQILERANEVRA